MEPKKSQSKLIKINKLVPQHTKSKKRRDDGGPIKNVTISDARTGFVVFESVMRWPVGTNTANLGSLIQSFYQFAREVDDGEIASVNFVSNSRKSRRPSTGSSDGRSHQSSNSKPAAETMKMLCRRNAVFVVSVFYDMKGHTFIPIGGPREDLEEFLRKVELEFQIKCGELYVAQKDRISGLLEADEDVVDETTIDIRSRFAFFKSHLDNLIRSTFSTGQRYQTMLPSSGGTNSPAPSATTVVQSSGSSCQQLV